MKKNKFFFPTLIFLIWLLTYILSQVFIEQKLGWDEMGYMAIARGIAEDLDCSSRTYTTVGLIKFGYPSSLINFPIFPTYLAIFFKLFGSTLHIAYFANWLSALGTCLFIYFIFLLFDKENRFLAFITSISYLLCPGILKNCDSGMMEQFGCFLLCLFLFLILRDYVREEFNFFTILKISISMVVLWLYKSLYVGYLLGIFVFICLAYAPKLAGKKLSTKISFPVFLCFSYVLFIILFYMLKKFVFLPVTPMMSFTYEQDLNQTYADFLGGFFNDFSKNFSNNINYFFNNTLAPYFLYPSGYTQYYPELHNLTGYFSFLGVYFLLLIVISIITFSHWKKLAPEVKIFLAFTVSSVITFNFIFNVFFRSNHSNIWRYNLYYLPIFLISLWLVLKILYGYIKPFVKEHSVAWKLLMTLFLLFIYLPSFISTLVQYIHYEEWFHETAKKNADIIRDFLKGSRPMFIYFNNGTHTTYMDYPIRVIIKDATNEQLLKVNKILPKPIEFLFLSPSDWLYKLNEEKILKAEPILNEEYVFYGYSREPDLVVYKLNA